MSCNFTEGEFGKFAGWRSGLAQASEKFGDDRWERTDGSVLFKQRGEKVPVIFTVTLT